MVSAMAITAFQVGRTYFCRSLCDHDCKFVYAVVKRTEKMITIKSGPRIVSRKVRVRDDVEEIDPQGRYSMSPVLKADRPWVP